jgi:hypothetical protein
MARLVFQNPPHAAAEALVAQANREDGSDNSTVIVVGRERRPLPKISKAEPPAAVRQSGKSFLLPLLAGLVLGILSTIIFFIYF